MTFYDSRYGFSIGDWVRFKRVGYTDTYFMVSGQDKFKILEIEDGLLCLEGKNLHTGRHMRSGLPDGGEGYRWTDFENVERVGNFNCKYRCKKCVKKCDFFEEEK
jgi:hypothetical protein